MRLRLTALLTLALSVAACGDVPLGKIQDRRLDPGAPRPNLAPAPKG